MIRLNIARIAAVCILVTALHFDVSAGSGKKKRDAEKPRKGQVAEQQQEAAPQPAPTPPPAPANGSLYTDDAFGGDLLGDFKPRRPGDMVFVDVVESSQATVSSAVKRGRDSGTLGGIVGAVGALPVPGAAIIGGVAGGLGSRKYEGKGSTERQSDMRARIAARVVEVLPNGDLRIEAEKFVKINKETERLVLSGIVRRRDVSADNAVPTTAVGDLYVELNGKGVASSDNAPGWLSRLFEKIAPF